MTNHTKENLGLDALLNALLGEIVCSKNAVITICESDTA